MSQTSLSEFLERSADFQYLDNLVSQENSCKKQHKKEFNLESSLNFCESDLSLFYSNCEKENLDQTQNPNSLVPENQDLQNVKADIHSRAQSIEEQSQNSTTFSIVSTQAEPQKEEISSDSSFSQETEEQIYTPVRVTKRIVNQRKKKKIIRTIEEVEKLLNQQKVLRKQSFSREQIADKFEISKKTLDEYFYEYKKGKKSGFEFEKYKKEKMGFLRNFNKEKNTFLRQKKQ